MLLVLAATRFELPGLGGLPHARAGGVPIACLDTGIGRAAVERALGRRLACPPSALLNVGLAGGLRTGLAVGAPIVVEEVCTEQAADAPRVLDPGLREWALGLLAPYGARPARLATAGVIIDGKAAKTQLGSATGAAAVDMEGYWLARLADRAGLPLLALKVVCDPADMPVPGAAWLASARWSALAPHLLARPREAARFVRLAATALAARRVLLSLARRLIRAWPPRGGAGGAA